MSLDDVIFAADQLVEFHASFREKPAASFTLSTLEAYKMELSDLWQALKAVYACFVQSTDDKIKESLAAVKAKYQSSSDTYIACLSEILNFMQSLQQNETPMSPPAPIPDEVQHSSPLDQSSSFNQTSSHSIKLPPCDTEVFHGSYLEWPAFRDMYTAVYINHAKLSPVQKLFHLRAKTKGDAFKIVSKFSLTDENFILAWTALQEHYENKRILVNNQIKILLNQSLIPFESAKSLKTLQSNVNDALIALKSHGIDVDSWDAVITYLCSTRLPEKTLALWEESLTNPAEIPSWSSMNMFLSNRYRVLESVSDVQETNKTTRLTLGKQSFGITRPKVHLAKVTSACRVCKGQHPLRFCPQFLGLSSTARRNLAQKYKYCFNCLSVTHRVSTCPSTNTCFRCKSKHHTLLHIDAASSPPNPALQPTSSTIEIQSTPESSHRSFFSKTHSQALLATAIVRIRHHDLDLDVRALLDPGSEVSFISDEIQKRANLPTQAVQAQISGMGSTKTASSSKLCSFTLTSTLQKDFSIPVRALVLKKLTGDLPSISMNIGDLPRDLDIPLADPLFHKSSKIDLLIGADLYPFVIRDGVKTKVLYSLMAQNTVFGWVLLGPLPEVTPSHYSSHSIFISFFNDVSLDRDLQRFWELEELPKVPILTSAEQYCESLYKESTYRDGTGRYVVKMPFKADLSTQNGLGRSRDIAFKLFLRNEKRLLSEPQFKEQYDSVLSEYATLNHMKPTKSFEIIHDQRINSYYLPHHAVIKPDSLTTKLRVVFNASQASSNGISLNEVLYPGPTLQTDIALLVLKWRFYKYVFNSDIEKMYRQILVHPDHTPFQRILFRETPHQDVTDFELKTVTFGVNCAPYLAIRTLRHLAEEVKDSHPLASKILTQDFYVDDVLSGAHDLSSARIAQTELISVLSSAGFNLRKWTSNSRHLLEHLPPEHILKKDFLNIDRNSSIKTLGICWNAAADEFSFSVEEFTRSPSITKRNVLSAIAKLYDPAGWLSPIVISAKILMQQIWKDGTKWDENLLPATKQQWLVFLANFPDIQTIRIPRWVKYSPWTTIQLHGFCDSSEKAYAAVVYVRAQHSLTSFSSQLLWAKSKVAPVRPISLPRLELQGAVLLSRMARVLIDNLPFLQVEDVKLWTDSTIVLAWLSKHPSTWKTFVANRTSEILDNVPTIKWSHVSSSDNPADLATRGVCPSELRIQRIWWEGPLWLQQPESSWPSALTLTPDESVLERKPVQNLTNQIADDFETILGRFSTWHKAVRVLCYIFRFFHVSRDRSVRSHFASDSLLHEEIIFTKNRLIILTQRKYYSSEYATLSQGKPLKSKSCLLTLNPFLDENGIIRSHGRLSSSTLSYAERFPILLSYNCYISHLFVEYVHQVSLHGEIQLMLRLIRSEYWIPRIKNLIKKCIRNCMPCVRYKRKLHTQIMGALPKERTTLSLPFTNTGIDFAGPFLIKTYYGRSCRLDKGYVCLFVCFATKAIHLEAVSSLTTEAFLAAFTRFVARRGLPSQVFSDHGTNFTGASKLLLRDFHQALIKYSNKNCQKWDPMKWNFIPPGAPHMGGLWEAGVKSFKTHFRKVAGNAKFTFEEFTTLLARIESCLNSRPLSPTSENPMDLVPLTPGHFIRGGLLLSSPEPPQTEQSLSLMNRWKNLKILHHQFSIRWKEEYLKELHKRYKWKNPQRDIQIGDLVIVRNEQLPPNEWRLGRVLKVYHGSDRRTRVADIRTQRGIISRPIVKLCVLLPQ